MPALQWEGIRLRPSTRVAFTRLSRLVAYAPLVALVWLGALIVTGAPTATITDVHWYGGGKVIEVLISPFPAWDGWRMYLNGAEVAMPEEGPGMVVRPNGPLSSATGVIFGTEPWVSPLSGVDFPCSGTLQFEIPGVGKTNVYSFDLRGVGCCTASDCAAPAPVPPPAEDRASSSVSRPPVADRITVSAPDPQGTATVTGDAGAVAPGAYVFLVNVSAKNVAVTRADSGGGFSAQVFCPPGSSLLVKHDPTGAQAELWQTFQQGRSVGDLSALDALWGTIVHVGDAATAEQGQSRKFSAAGCFREGGAWAGWWMNGTLTLHGAAKAGPLGASAGTRGKIEGTLRVTSSALTNASTGSLSLHMGAGLYQLFGRDGEATPWGIWFTGQLFTPTGIPIEVETDGPSWGLGSTEVRRFRRVSGTCVEAEFEIEIQVPRGIDAGVYRPGIYLAPVSIPLGTGTLSVDVWYNFDPIALLPSFSVGEVESPRIPWVLFGDVPVNGMRGVTAREDRGGFELTNRLVYPTHHAVICPVDEVRGDLVPYRLDPGSHWLSGSDRRAPCPPHVPLAFPSGQLAARISKPDGSVDLIGPAPVRQAAVKTPTTWGGGLLDQGSGQISDVYHVTTAEDAFSYVFDQYGDYTVELDGSVEDIYGNAYEISGAYDFTVARVLDLDPAELPSAPYIVGNWFAPGLHVFPAVPAEVEIRLTHLPNSVPERAVIRTVKGIANRYGIFSTDEAIELSQPGEYRVDITARYETPDGVLWAGTMSWGSVVASANSPMEAHGRRGMDYGGSRIDDMPAWFETFDLPSSKVGIEMYYPYFSGDVHWGNEDRAPGDSIHPAITIKDTTSNSRLYKILRQHWADNRTGARQPPSGCGPADTACLEKRIAVGEAPLFIATSDGSDPRAFPEKIDLWGYWYASSERPDVRVREVVSVDSLGTGYWRFNDTYGYQIGEGASGDLPGDLKWEFGGAVLREPRSGTAEYAAYASLWVLLPHGDRIGARVTPPFQDATGASLNGGPIMTLLGKDVDMLFLPKGVRPGDVLMLGDAVAFSGHVGPPLDSRVDVTITSPSGMERKRSLRANQVGWVFDPTFTFAADEVGQWTISVRVEHDRPYVGNGVVPTSHNTGTVLGTDGSYCFYVANEKSERLTLTSPAPGRLGWRIGRAGADDRVQPVTFRGVAPGGVDKVYVTVFDKGVVMAQSTLTPAADGAFSYTYDAKALNRSFSFVSVIAHEGLWEGLADEVTISFLAVGGEEPQAALIHLIGEEVFIVADSL